MVLHDCIIGVDCQKYNEWTDRIPLLVIRFAKRVNQFFGMLAGGGSFQSLFHCAFQKTGLQCRSQTQQQRHFLVGGVKSIDR